MENPTDTLGHVSLTHRANTIVAEDSKTGVTAVGHTKPEALRNLARALTTEDGPTLLNEDSSSTDGLSDELL